MTVTDTQSDSDDVSRRNVLKQTAALGSLTLVGGAATGVAAADQEDGRFNDSPGRGGQSVLKKADYRADQEFEFTERSGDSNETVDGAKFQCNKGKGKSIFLVAWFFKYTDSDEEYVLYTRSNNIDTDNTYRWNPSGGKNCPNGIQKLEDGELVVEDAVQTGYQAVGRQ